MENFHSEDKSKQFDIQETFEIINLGVPEFKNVRLLTHVSDLRLIEYFPNLEVLHFSKNFKYGKNKSKMKFKSVHSLSKVNHLDVLNHFPNVERLYFSKRYFEEATEKCRDKIQTFSSVEKINHVRDVSILKHFPNLRFLHFNRKFDKSLDNFIFSDKLEKLYMSRDFNQSVDNLILPNSLIFLRFGMNFDKSVDNLTLLKKTSSSPISTGNALS